MTGVLAIDTYKITNRYGKCRQRYVENNLTQILSIFFLYPPSSPGLPPVLGLLERYMTPTLDTALLISSRAGADLG